MGARELDDGLQDVLLRHAAGGVLGLGHVSELSQQIDVRPGQLDGLAGQEQLRVSPLDLVHHGARAHGDVGVGDLGVLLEDGLAKVAFAAPGELLGQHEHVHVRVGRVQRVDGPLPDLRLEHRRRQEASLRGPRPRRVVVASQCDQCGIALERLVERRLDRQRRPCRSRHILRDDLGRREHSRHQRREQSKLRRHASSLTLRDLVPEGPALR
jgi:hypothetical protein